MIYPNICLTIGKPIVEPGFSTEATVSSFLEDMLRVSPQICNKSLSILEPNKCRLSLTPSTLVPQVIVEILSE